MFNGNAHLNKIGADYPTVLVPDVRVIPVEVGRQGRAVKVLVVDQRHPVVLVVLFLLLVLYVRTVETAAR